MDHIVPNAGEYGFLHVKRGGSELFAEMGEQFRNGDAVVEKVIDDQSERRFDSRLDRVEFVIETAMEFKEILRFGGKSLSRCRRSDGMGRALEKLDAEGFFKRLDAIADRRRRFIESRCGGC